MIMMRQRLLTAVVGVASFFTLLFGVGAGHSMLTATAMPNMGKQMPQGQCQSSCTPQSNTAIDSQKTVIEDKDIEPQPAEPYYLAFMGVGWSLVLLLSVYLLRHLHWRPPDLYKLNSVYRI
jgi:hypothetical protein